MFRVQSFIYSDLQACLSPDAFGYILFTLFLQAFNMFSYFLHICCKNEAKFSSIHTLSAINVGKRIMKGNIKNLVFKLI